MFIVIDYTHYYSDIIDHLLEVIDLSLIQLTTKLLLTCHWYN